MRSHSHLNTAKKIIDAYDGTVPFAIWLKEFFRSDKKFGSRDRKQISHTCYCYYRLGVAFKEMEADQRLLLGLFLCSESSDRILEELKPEWNDSIGMSLDEKIKFLDAEKEVGKIFPFADELSEEIDKEHFVRSLLLQPDLYLRIRPGKQEKVTRQLEGAGIAYRFVGENCVELSNQTKVDQVVAVHEDVVVQDYNSQKTIELLEDQLGGESKLAVWDCCAASGGKSILFHDRYPNARLTVSDVRESILINLAKRFKRAGIANYDSFIADVSTNTSKLPRKMDVVICDAPCTGSGTWGRTPEQLSFFKKEKIEYYANLQKNIVTSAVKAMKAGGYFLYITCSVFQKENEEVVHFAEENLSLKRRSMQYMKGYDRKADTLFTALFSAL